MAAEHDLGSRVRMNGMQIPEVPAPLINFVDRPLPAADHKTEFGQEFSECIDKAGWPKYYADQWHAYAITSHGNWTLLVGASGNQLATCEYTKHGTTGKDYSFVPMDPMPVSAKPQMLDTPPSLIFKGPKTEAYHQFLVGTIPSDGKRLVVTFGDHTTCTATLMNGLWLMHIKAVDSPDYSPEEQQERAITKVTVEDARGKVIFDGPPVIIPAAK